MAVTYFQTSAAAAGGFTGPTGTGGTTRDLEASRTAGTASTGLATGNMNAGILCNQNFFTPASDPGTDGATGDYTVVVRVTVQNANIGIQVFLRRYNSAGTAQGTDVPASEGSQTAGAASRTFTWTSASLGTWSVGDRLLIRVQLTNTSGSMNQSATIGVDTDADTVATPFAGPTTNAPAGVAVGTGDAVGATVQTETPGPPRYRTFVHPSLAATQSAVW